MTRTRIKICGIMHEDDARFAADIGADAIGIVFHPASRRCVKNEQALRIVGVLPPFVMAVGLFVDASAEQMLHAAHSLGLGALQLHGEEPPELVAALAPFPVIKAVRVRKDDFASRLQRWRGQGANLRGVLLETDQAAPGGTGVENDWATIAQARADRLFDGLPPLIAAGGLTPENVARVIQTIRPWAVDVSSGVEDSPGRKSRDKLRAFVHAVHAA